MPGSSETSPAAVPASRGVDHDPRLAGGESDLDLWGDWPDDELASPESVSGGRLPRLTGAPGGPVSEA